MKYNMAPPTPRLGLTKRNNYASLHVKAHDKHVGPDIHSKDLDAEPENEDFNRPPEESDQDSDSVSSSTTSESESKKTISTTLNTAGLDKTSAGYFIPKTKTKSAVTYGKGKRTGYSHTVQKARPPRRKIALASGFLRPAAASVNEDLVRKLEGEQDFNHKIVPSKASENRSNAKSEHFQHPPVGDSSIHPKANNSVISLALGNEAFIAPPSEAPSESQPFVSSQVSDLINDIDGSIKPRAGKTSSQNDFQNDTESGRSAKRRKTTPEPEFVAPPPPLSSLNTGGSPLSVPLALALSEGSQLPYIDMSTCPSPPNLKDSLSNSQQTTCPMCLMPVEQATIDEFRKQNKLSNTAHMTTRRQELFHKFHAKIEARRSWQERKYPNINWSKLYRRLTQHKAYLMSIVDGTQTSAFATSLQKTLSHRGRRSAILADERRAGETSAQDLGYYGTRGQRIVGDWLVREFSTQLRQQAQDDALIKLAGGVGGYIAKVLVPEAIQQLIRQDLWDTNGMLDALQARIRDVTSAESDGDTIRPADRDLRTLLESTALELDVSLADVQCLAMDSDIHWLARFVAADSAQCGLLLSEEMEDVVRLQDDEQDATQV